MEIDGITFRYSTIVGSQVEQWLKERKPDADNDVVSSCQKVAAFGVVNMNPPFETGTVHIAIRGDLIREPTDVDIFKTHEEVEGIAVVEQVRRHGKVVDAKVAHVQAEKAMWEKAIALKYDLRDITRIALIQRRASQAETR